MLTTNARAGPRAGLLLFATFMLTMTMLVTLPAGPASAAHLETDFEIDGNRAVDGAPPATDWANHPTTRTYRDLCDRLDGSGANNDDIITPGTKLGGFDWTIVNQRAPKKGDLCLVQTAWEVDSSGDLIFFLSWERSDSDGEVTLYVPLDNGNGVAGPGDVLLRYDYDSAEKAIHIFMHSWTGSGWDSGTPISDESLADAALSGDLLFGETAINLSALGLFSSEGCERYYGAAVITETGQSEANATLKDWVSVNLNLSNCGTLVVEKIAVGGDATFGFTSTTLDPFSLTTTGGYDRTVFGLLEPGTYDVAESPLAGWTLTGTTCTGDMSPSEIVLGPNETVTCSFTNEKAAAITVVKLSEGDDGRFDFTSTEIGGFSLTTTDGTASTTFDDLEAGIYGVAEVTPGDTWKLSSATCDDGSDPAEISLEPGDHVTCTFTNTKLGSLVVVKHAFGGDGTFGFTSDSFGSFDLVTDEGVADIEFGLLEPGVYDVTETPPTGWDLTSATCSDGSDPATVSVEAGERVVCTFTNTARGSIEVIKLAEGGDDTFTFMSETLGDFDITTVDGTGSESFDELVNGTYDIVEFVPDDWIGSETVTCSDGSDSGAIGLEPGEHVTCTFANTARGSITIVKNSLGGDDTFGFESGTLGDFDLTTVDGTDSTTFYGLVPGTYDVAETADADWDLLSVACSDESDPDEIFLPAGENLTCTFTNQLVTADLAIEKVDLIDPIELNEDTPVGQIDYVVTVTNNGPYPATGVVVTDTLPVTTTFLSATPDKGACGHAAGVVTCAVGGMAVGETVDIAIAVTTESLGEVTDLLVENLVVVSGDQEESDLINNEAVESTGLVEVFPLLPPDVYLEKVDLVDPINLNPDHPIGMITYVITVGNRATAQTEATDVVVTDKLPPTTDFLSAVSDKGTCSYAAGVVTCEIGTLAVGEVVTITIEVTTETNGAVTDSIVENTATVTLEEVEDLSDNTDVEDTTITEVLGTLPETGADADRLAMIATALVLLGGAITVLTREERLI